MHSGEQFNALEAYKKAPYLHSVDKGLLCLSCYELGEDTNGAF
jgi:hypothetical protein